MYDKEKYLKNKHTILKRQSEYAKRNRKAVSLKTREWNRNNPEKYILNNARSRASKKGLEFNLTTEDIIIPTHCPYLGIPLTFILGDGKKESNVSIDRINSDIGYVKGNIQIISKKANTMKSNASQEELLIFARNIIALSS